MIPALDIATDPVIVAIIAERNERAVNEAPVDLSGPSRRQVRCSAVPSDPALVFRGQGEPRLLGCFEGGLGFGQVVSQRGHVLVVRR